MSRVIATNEIKEEFDGVLETPLANFPFDFDVSSESANEKQTAGVHCSTSTSTTSNNSSFRLPNENDDQNCTAKSNTENDDSMTEDEVEEDIATNIGGDDTKSKACYLNCSQADCDDKLDTFAQFRQHLSNKHGLPPHQCFCGCKSRFDKRWQLSRHLKDRPHSNFSCPVCAKVFSTENKTYRHWYHNHLTGRFECNIDDCDKVVDTRIRLHSHQQHTHCPESKRIKCPHEGCSSSFVRKKDLKVHEMIHLNTKPFHCKWPKCAHRANERRYLIKHIRNVHFKKQQKNGTVGERDHNKYIRVEKK